MAALINDGIFELDHIPGNLEWNEHQELQISAHKSSKTIINHAAIQSELSALNYPLYFFDYETYPAALPLFNGFKPHQHIPFQFSLHVLATPTNNELIHHEYVHESRSDPSLSIILKLQEYIGNTGTIIVWHKNFEQSRNSELAQRHPDHKEFLDNINSRVYDLEDIFKKNYYVHPKFRGKTSIKKILPVLVPELTYENLEIRDGTSAAQKWHRLIYGALSEMEKKQYVEHLKRYCGLDSYAMYALWKKLKEECC